MPDSMRLTGKGRAATTKKLGDGTHTQKMDRFNYLMRLIHSEEPPKR